VLHHHQRPVLEVFGALQLQIMAPSSLLSHLGSDLQLSKFFIWLQSVVPMQAHLRSPP
jgi:hypothetical protein